MKTKLAIGSIILAGALAFSLPASANILAQRNCNPQDVTLPGKGETNQTTCKWKANDDNDMQITFHGNNIATKAHVACTFTPANGADDNITQLVPKKAAKISSVNNNGRSLSFNIQAPSNGDNANVLFYVNNSKSYQADDTMVCDLTPYL